jgi:predicted metal-dependent HD superfamily phosphohydrolase
MTDVESRWPQSLKSHRDIRQRLVEAYAEPHRAYHNLRHLDEVFERIDVITASNPRAIDRDAVLLAAWFHDSVYEAQGDDEERSAVLAARELADAGVDAALVSEVVRLVRLTATHQVSESDVEGQVLCDADLGILAADARRYEEYTAGVRREYQHVSDHDFRRGRAQILGNLLDAPSLFNTRFAKERWEDAARANVSREIRRLEEAGA